VAAMPRQPTGPCLFRHRPRNPGTNQPLVLKCRLTSAARGLSDLAFGAN
jgi:hypothetical protein